MKKIVYIWLLLVIIFPSFVFAENDDTELIKKATSGLLMEASTGEIIYEKDKDKEVAIASMTKMVAQLIILEKIEQGNIKWGDIVTVSKNASDMGGSQIYLSTNEKMTIRDLFKGISMASANDATVAMAEYISGSENKFVKLMNERVKKLGLKNTVFKNSTGLDEEGHFSTANDMAIIAKELLKHKQILDFSGVYEDYLRVDTPNKFWLVNTNKLVRTYNGSDGLKTGHTDAAKYCIAATAKRDNMRLIAIVLGEETASTRNEEAAALLDYGFNTKKVEILKSKDEIIKELPIEKSTSKTIKISPKEDITILTDKQNNKNNYETKIVLNKIELPINKKQVVGKIDVYQNKKLIKTEKLISNNSAKKLTYLQVLFNNLKNITTGIM